jgi:hypothetical protein
MILCWTRGHTGDHSKAGELASQHPVLNGLLVLQSGVGEEKYGDSVFKNALEVVFATGEVEIPAELARPEPRPAKRRRLSAVRLVLAAELSLAG